MQVQADFICLPASSKASLTAQWLSHNERKLLKGIQDFKMFAGPSSVFLKNKEYNTLPPREKKELKKKIKYS